MGLQEILDEIQKEAEGRNNEVLTAARMEADKIVMAKLDDLNAAYGKLRRDLDLELKRLKAKLTAKAELDVQRDRAKAELKLIEDLLHESYRNLIDTTKKDESRYTDFLKRLVKRSSESVGENELGVSFSKDDERLFDSVREAFGKKLKLLPPVKISGGVICVSGDTYIDYSLDNIFDHLKPDFIKMISDSMKG
jgi:vacuolar-type H+-ATPase subunit E/Vma4